MLWVRSQWINFSTVTLHTVSFVLPLLWVCSQWINCSSVTLNRPLFLTCCECVPSGLTVPLLVYTFLCSSPAVSVFQVDQLFHCYPTQSFVPHLLCLCSQWINCSSVTIHIPLFLTCCSVFPVDQLFHLYPYTMSFVPHLLWVCSSSWLTVRLLPYTVLCSSPAVCVPSGLHVMFPVTRHSPLFLTRVCVPSG
jgi:hypothetical protein